MATFGYQGDNLTVYQLDWDAADSALLAGNLLPAVPTSPIFPCLWNPRHMVVRRLVAGQYVYRHVVCNAGNAAYHTGPGATVTISGAVYDVVTSVGESRAYSA